MNIPGKHAWTLGAAALFGSFVAVSAWSGSAPGQQIGRNFALFFGRMVRILPCVFVLIGLFDVWVSRETVERHFGRGSGPLAYLWAVLLAGTVVGGLHVALPVGHALYVKRARLGVVLTYLSASAVCRVPMTLFEASFLGWRFTSVRFVVSLPLLVLASAILGGYLEHGGYRMPFVGGEDQRRGC